MILMSVTPIRGHLVELRFDTGEERQIDQTVWEDSPYRLGFRFTEDEVTALCALSERRRAENKAVFLLSKRDYCRQELEERLCYENGRYYADRRDAAHAAAARMVELGYVNDEKYAAHTAERLWHEKGYPRRRIQEELLSRGLDRDLVRRTLSSLDINDLELALAFLRKKRYTVPQNTRERQHIAGALARYGFGSDVARRAILLLRDGEVTDE